MRRIFFACIALVFISTLQVSAQASGNGSAYVKRSNNLYIVQMTDAPVVNYAGGVPGLKATKPRKGQKIDPTHPDVLAYASYLDGKHSNALTTLGGGRKVYDYHYTFNGFAAELTSSQADALKSVAGVLAITKDELQTGDTSSTPTFLGLTDPGTGLWDKLGGFGNAGEGMIIGLVDSGVWPEGLAMSDRTGLNGNGTQDGKLDYHQIPGWHGKCTPGEAFPASLCNQKLIGAQWFDGGWGGDAGIKDPATGRPWEFTSTRDYNGHGSHTSSTAGGNHGVVANGPAAVFGAMSGIAPRARIAMYKALWSLQDGSQANGFTSDLVAAIDQAVADGVDVINYSISGTQTNFLDPVQVAFFNAADAGIFVTCSAGNSGPTTATVAHPGPWLTTVAAGTHNRNLLADVKTGDNATYNGASANLTPIGPLPFIDATTAGLPGADPTFVRLCYAAVDNGGTPVLDPTKIAGKIVLCDRGNNARVNKSLAVLEAGGVGMVLVNTSANTLNADFHYVPTVHLSDTYRTALKAYAANPTAMASITKAAVVLNVPAPLTASFSSRGPLRAGNGDLLKPDLIGPGQDILASVAPPGNAGALFGLYSGTSMSAPHVAGLGTLLKQLHPDWSPMAIKSALMTTGSDVLDGPNTNPLVIFRQGAGHVRPNLAADPGLVFDSNSNDWFAFLCGTTSGVNPSVCSSLASAGYSFDPSDMNTASIAIGDLVGSQTVRRKVTNVGGSAATYTASYTGLTGFTVNFNPASLTIGAGKTTPVGITITRTTAPFAAYTGGQITWTDGTHTVRIPVVVKPVALAAPAEVSGSYPVRFGYAGPFTASARGLVPAETHDGVATQDPTKLFVPDGPGTVKFTVAIPAGTTYARFSLFDANVSPASDLDLYVYRGTTQVGSSGGGSSSEEVDLLNPPADNYTVYVHGYNVPTPANFTMFAWALGSSAAGNMTVTAPASATTGGSANVDLVFSGLTAGTKYLGSVAYSGSTNLPNPTIVRVDP